MAKPKEQTVDTNPVVIRTVETRRLARDSKILIEFTDGTLTTLTADDITLLKALEVSVPKMGDKIPTRWAVNTTTAQISDQWVTLAF